MKQLFSNTLKLFVLGGIAFLFACKPASESRAQNPEHYDLAAGEKFNMPESLLEISGIAFNTYDPAIVYAIQDEEGRLFSLQWGNKKASNSKFGPRGDYEDLAILRGQVYVINSSGDMLSFPLSAKSADISSGVQTWDGFLPKGEYESLYADEQEQVLYALSKSGGKKKKKTRGFKINIDQGTKNPGQISEFELDQNAIESMGFKLNSGLRVSALTRHPQNKEWYILSSAEKLLVIAGPDWKIKGVYDLDASTFNQPEGIAFDKNLNLYISNEGDELTNGNVLKFRPLAGN